MDEAGGTTRGTVQIPAKTFLVGEYLALAGGPSVVVLTGPPFEFCWERRAAATSFIKHPFHRDSPAGRFLNGLEATAGGFTVEFSDPYRGLGGFGASTAEFLGAWLLAGRRVWSEGAQTKDLVEMLDVYRVIVPSASGADLVSQAVGGVAIWDRNKQAIEKYDWPFEGLRLSLFQTGKKIRTHEHLQSGRQSLESIVRGISAELAGWVEEASLSFASADGDRLVAAVRGVGKVLDSRGLVAEHTSEALRALSEISGVRAAKGCGAMGADVIAILHEESAFFELKEFCRENRFQFWDADIWSKAVRVVS